MSIKEIIQLFDPGTVFGALALGGVLFALGLVLSWMIHRLLKTLLLHDHSEDIDQITLTFLSRLSILLLWMVLATFYAPLVPVLNRLGTALLAGVSLVSVVIGFAAQTTLGNLISGISLVLYKPFRSGDRLQVMAPTKDECDVGTVETISLGFTVLRTDDGREIIVANGTMAQQTMIKFPRDQDAAKPSDGPVGSA